MNVPSFHVFIVREFWHHFFQFGRTVPMSYMPWSNNFPIKAGLLKKLSKYNVQQVSLRDCEKFNKTLSPRLYFVTCCFPRYKFNSYRQPLLEHLHHHFNPCLMGYSCKYCLQLCFPLNLVMYLSIDYSLSGDDKYSVRNSENLPQLFQIYLRKKKIFLCPFCSIFQIYVKF